MRTANQALEIVRARVRSGDLDGAREVVVQGMQGYRAALSIALAEHCADKALRIAGALAVAGWWDSEVAATIVVHGGDDHPLALRAASIVHVVTCTRAATIEDVAELLRDLFVSGALLEAFLASEEAIRRWPGCVELWGVVALARNELGDDEGALDALDHAAARDERNPFVRLVAAQLAHRRGDHGAVDTCAQQGARKTSLV